MKNFDPIFFIAIAIGAIIFILIFQFVIQDKISIRKMRKIQKKILTDDLAELKKMKATLTRLQDKFYSIEALSLERELKRTLTSKIKYYERIGKLGNS